jgi:hypothetical protein
MEATMSYRPPPVGVLPIAVAVAVALLGVACSDDDDSAPVDSASAGTNQPAPEAGNEGTRDRDESSDDRSAIFGSGTGQLPNFDTGAPVSLRIDVTGLERNGDLVELRMSLTNEDDELEFMPVNSFVDPEFAAIAVYDLSGVRLIDEGERKAYLPVIDSQGVCLCSNNLVNVTVPPADSLELEAAFGGIPDTVTTLDLDMPGFSAITGLAIQGE